MRLVLEWLGILRPDPRRREPVALPAWAPYIAAAIFTTMIGAGSMLGLLLLHALIR